MLVDSPHAPDAKTDPLDAPMKSQHQPRSRSSVQWNTTSGISKMSQEMIMGTLSSYTTDTLVSHKVIRRRSKDEQVLFFGSFLPRISTDKSTGCVRICNGRMHDTNTLNTLHLSKNNGIAERAVRRATEGTATVQSELRDQLCHAWHDFASCAMCTAKWPMVRLFTRRFGVYIRRFFGHLRSSKSGTHPSLRKMTQDLCGKMDATRILHGIYYYVRVAKVRRICSSRTATNARTGQPLGFTSSSSSTRKSHKKDLSHSSIFLNPHVAKCLPRGSPEQDEEEAVTIFEEDTGEDCWSMSGDVTYRHHEVHVLTLYIPDDTTLATPLKQRWCHEANVNKHRQRVRTHTER